MEYIWQEKDIRVGMYVCKNYDPKDLKFLLTTTYKIGYDYSEFDKEKADTKSYKLISMTDGLIGEVATATQLANSLTKTSMMPMPHKLLLAVMATEDRNSF